MSVLTFSVGYRTRFRFGLSVGMGSISMDAVWIVYFFLLNYRFVELLCNWLRSPVRHLLAELEIFKKMFNAYAM